MVRVRVEVRVRVRVRVRVFTIFTVVFPERPFEKLILVDLVNTLLIP